MPLAKHGRPAEEEREREQILMAKINSLNEQVKLLNQNNETLTVDRDDKIEKEGLEKLIKRSLLAH